MKKTRSRKVARVHDAEYLDSPVMRVGVVFIMIMAIFMVAWAVKLYTPPLQ